jgi:hypothetical protein
MNHERRAFQRGATAGLLLALGAMAMYWFISPTSLEATGLRQAAVAGQALVGFGGAALLWLNQRRSESSRAV